MKEVKRYMRIVLLVFLKKKWAILQGLFWKIRACLRFLRKRAKKGKIFENLGKNVQNLKIF